MPHLTAQCPPRSLTLRPACGTPHTPLTLRCSRPTHTAPLSSVTHSVTHERTHARSTDARTHSHSCPTHSCPTHSCLTHSCLTHSCPTHPLTVPPHTHLRCRRLTHSRHLHLRGAQALPPHLRAPRGSGSGRLHHRVAGRRQALAGLAPLAVPGSRGRRRLLLPEQGVLVLGLRLVGLLLLLLHHGLLLVLPVLLLGRGGGARRRGAGVASHGVVAQVAN